MRSKPFLAGLVAGAAVAALVAAFTLRDAKAVEELFAPNTLGL